MIGGEPVPDRAHPVPDPEAVAAARGAEPVREPALAAAAAARAGTLGAADALVLQRAAGNAAVGRLLARQPLPELADPTKDDPFDLTDAEWEEIAAESVRRSQARAAELRKRLMDTLDGPDRLQFLSRMRDLDPLDRRELQRDAAFQEAIRKRFRGMALWAIELTLEYGARKPHAVNAISPAIHARDWSRTRDLLMAYGTLRDVPGIRQAIAAQFTGREAEDLAAVLAEGPGERAESGRRHSKEAHYEKGVFSTPGGDANFELVRLPTQLRVIVRIGLQEDPAATTTAIKDADVARWEEGIKRIWNNRFRLRSDAKSLDVWFVPVFVYHDPNAHQDVTVKGANARSAQSTWHATDSATTAAHEFGHMLGAQDEYGLPGTIAEVPASANMKAIDIQHSTWEGIFGVKRPVNTDGYTVEGLMGDHYKSTAVEARHLWDVEQVFNAKLRKPGEAEWKTVKR